VQGSHVGAVALAAVFILIFVIGLPLLVYALIFHINKLPQLCVSSLLLLTKQCSIPDSLTLT